MHAGAHGPASAPGPAACDGVTCRDEFTPLALGLFLCETVNSCNHLLGLLGRLTEWTL